MTIGKKWKIPALLIAVIMTFTVFAIPQNSVEAKTSVSIPKSVSVTEGHAKTLKIKGIVPKEAVKWKSTDKTVAKVKAANKNGTKAKIIGVKGGTCKIKAKVLVKKKKSKRTYKILTCKVTVNEDWSDPAPDSDDLAKDYAYNKSLGIQASDEFVTETANFAFDLLKESINEESKSKNMLISPDSVATALVMAENGSNGQTQGEISQVLGGNISADDYNGYLAGLNNRLKGSQNVHYKVANSIWADSENSQVLPEFIKKNKAYHNASMYSLKFNNAAADRINSWVDKHTKSMIKKIVDKPIDSDMKMVLINTIAFQGDWQNKFEPPYDKNFTDAAGNVKRVKTLGDSGAYEYLQMDNAEGFVKYYKGKDMAFVGLLPDSGTTPEELIQSMTGEDFLAAWNAKQRLAMSISLPQFKYDYGLVMNEPLKRLGIQTAFDEDNADFSGIFNDDDRYYISRVMHKTHIELTKDGTRAAAATSIELYKATAMREDKALHFDRPFVYALVDTETGIPLFIGIVNFA